MPCIDKCIRSFRLAERRIVPLYSPPGLILMVLEVKSKAEKITPKIRQSNVQDLTLLVTPTSSEPRFITAAGRLVLEPMCATSVLVPTQGAGLTEVIPHGNVPKNYACMTAMGIMDLYPDRQYYIRIVKFDKVDINLPKPQEACEFAAAPIEIVHIKASASRTPMAHMRMTVIAQ